MVTGVGSSATAATVGATTLTTGARQSRTTTRTGPSNTRGTIATVDTTTLTTDARLPLWAVSAAPGGGLHLDARVCAATTGRGPRRCVGEQRTARVHSSAGVSDFSLGRDGAAASGSGSGAGYGVRWSRWSTPPKGVVNSPAHGRVDERRAVGHHGFSGTLPHAGELAKGDEFPTCQSLRWQAI